MVYASLYHPVPKIIQSSRTRVTVEREDAPPIAKISIPLYFLMVILLKLIDIGSGSAVLAAPHQIWALGKRLVRYVH